MQLELTPPQFSTRQEVKYHSTSTYVCLRYTRLYHATHTFEMKNYKAELPVAQKICAPTLLLLLPHFNAKYMQS